MTQAQYKKSMKLVREYNKNLEKLTQELTNKLVADLKQLKEPNKSK